MVMPCSRSASRPSTSSAKSTSSPVVPCLLRIALERGELVLEDLLGVGKQPADQRRLAVVDRAAGEKPQQRLLLLPGKIVADVLGGAICSWPSMWRILRNILRASFFPSSRTSSRSIRRPWRSEVRAVSISLTMSSRLSALGFDRAGQRIAAQRPEPHQPVFDSLAGPQRHALVVAQDQHAVALDDRPLLGEIERHDRDVFLQDVLPDIELGPVGQRKDADRLAWRDAGVVDLPHFRALVLGVPGMLGVAEGEDALLGARLFLVAPRAAECRVEAVFVQRLAQRHRLHDMRMGVRAMDRTG